MPLRPALLALALASLVIPAGAAFASDDDASREKAPPPPAQAALCDADASAVCPSYDRYINVKFAFSVDIPTFFTKKGADADGRGQPFAYGTKAKARAWAMYNVPQMSLGQLFGDWTRRGGVTYQAVAGNTWVVRGKDGGRLYYSRSILADGIIVSIEITYDPSLAAAFEPILARVGPSLQVLDGQAPAPRRKAQQDCSAPAEGTWDAPAQRRPAEGITRQPLAQCAPVRSTSSGTSGRRCNRSRSASSGPAAASHPRRGARVLRRGRLGRPDSSSEPLRPKDASAC